MSEVNLRTPIIQKYFQQYLSNEDAAAFIKKVSECYTTATLERLAENSPRISRRAAVLALGFVSTYESNAVMGRALSDRDRGVRILAENGIRQIWCRDGNVAQRQKLGIIIRLNFSRQFARAIEISTALLREAQWFAEVWNQRAIAHFNLSQFKQSIHDCHQTLELNPYHFGAATGMGQCYLELNDHVAALESFRRALKLNPGLEGVRAQVDYIQRTTESE